MFPGEGKPLFWFMSLCPVTCGVCDDGGGGGVLDSADKDNNDSPVALIISVVVGTAVCIIGLICYCVWRYQRRLAAAHGAPSPAISSLPLLTSPFQTTVESA